MRYQTTLVLLILVALLAGFIVLVERKEQSTQEREEQARRALRVDPARVSYLRFETKGLTLECAREGDLWMIVQPVRARADTAELDRILTGLRDLPRGEVITQSERKSHGITQAQYGFDQPRARITLGDHLQRRTILVGREALLGGSLYLKEEGGEDVVGTETNLLGLIPRSVAQMRDRALFHGSPDKVSRLELVGGGRFIQLSKAEPGTWMIQQPISARASPVKAQEILESLFGLRVERFVTDKAVDLSTYGLDNPQIKAVAAPLEPEAEGALLIGGTDEQNPACVYAKLGAGDSVYSIPTNVLSGLRPTVDDLRDRRLLTISGYDIRYVRLEEGEQVLELEEQGEDWEVTQPRQWKADCQRVQGLLNAWANAPIVSFLEGADTNETAREFAKPARVLTFARKIPPAEVNDRTPPMVAGADEFTVLVSGAPREMGRLLVELEHEGTPYEILSDVLRSVSTDPLFYRDREVLRINPDEVVRVSLLKNGKETAVEREASGAFQPVPAAGTADAEALKDLLANVEVLQAARFVEDDPKDLSRFGLEPPQSVLSFGLKGRSGLGKAILFGADAGEGEVYAMIRGQDVVFAVEKGLRDTLVQDLHVIPAAPDEEPVDRAATRPQAP